MDDLNLFGNKATDGPTKPPLIKRPWFIVLLSVVVMGGIVALSLNRVMKTLLHSRAEVAVPNIEGKSLMDALAILSNVGLNLNQEGTEFDQALPAGTIVRQHPPSGMKVRAGRAIMVMVSKGGQVVFVPSVVGKPMAEAQSLLAAEGLQMGAVSDVFSSDFNEGEAVSQIPSSGTVVTRGALIDVIVSKGLAPAGAPVMPDFSGKGADEVEQWANGVNAKVKISEDAKAVGLSGTVIKQDPLPGQPLLDGELVRVTIVPSTSAQGFRFGYAVPSDRGEVMVRIMVRDSHGESNVYEGKHKGGEKFEVPMSINSTARARIYLDDILQEEKVIEP